MSKVLHGDAGGNQLNASSDKAQLYGLKGNDTLISDGKSDVLLVGGGGEDSLIVMGGEATLSGGDGSDVFEFTYSADKKVSAVIEDLDPSKDKIVVNFIGNSAPQLSSVASGNDVVWSDADGNFNITLKSVRDNDYFDGDASDEVWEVLELTNAEREKENLSPLTMSEGLTEAASIRVQEITELGEKDELNIFRHNRPQGGEYNTVFEEIGKEYHNHAENITAGESTAREAVEDWMNSPTHRKNILDEEHRNYSKLGVGYNYDDTDPSDQRFYWLQLFADSLNGDSLGNPETVTAEELLNANIESNSATKFIAGDDEPNTIENNFYGVTISALGGNDSIINSGLNVSISGGADDDTIDSGGSFGTINAGTGDDQINLSDDAQEILIEYFSGEGSDTISGLNSTDTVSISGSEFTPAIDGDNIIVGVGSDSITLFGAASSGVQIEGTQSKIILGTQNADSLNNTDDAATIAAMGNDDTITNSGANVSISAGAGDDSISNSGENVLFRYDSGNDTINGFNETSTLQVAGGSYSSVTVGKDLILFGSGSTESIKILGASNLSSINIFDANNNPVEIGDAKYVRGTEEADSLINPVDGATIQAFGGDDTIQNNGDRVSINAGGGNDYVNNKGYWVTIYGGAGDDLINNNQQLRTAYFHESGNDTIQGFNDSDTLHIGGYTYETVTSDNDIIVNIIGYFETVSSVTLKDYPSGQKVNINPFVVNDPERGEEVYNSTDSVSVIGTANNDNLNNSGNNVTIAGLAGNDNIFNESLTSNVTIDGGEGSDVIYNNEGSYVSIDGGAGHDNIFNMGGFFVTINGGDGQDYIINDSLASNVSINGGTGDDTVLNIDGNNFSISGGDGDDYIGNYGDSVTIEGGSDNDSIRNAGSNALINGSDGNDLIDIWNGSDVSILGGTGDDLISLSSGSQNNFIRYADGDGNDTIWGISATDSISIAGGKYTRRFDRNDVIYEVGEGSITLKDGRNKPLPIIIGESGTSGGGSGGGNSGGSGGGSSSGNGGGSSGQSGGNTSGGTSASEGNTSDATSGMSATAGVSASNNNSGGSSSSGRINRTTTSSLSTTPSTTSTSSTVSAQLNADASQPSASSSATPKISLNAPTYANNPSGEDVVAAIQSGNENFKKHWGTEGNDTLYGGEGVDLFISGKNQGSDTFLNISAEDIVYLSDVTLNDLIGIKKTGDTVSISLKTGNTMTIQSSDSVSGAIVFADTTWHFTHNSQA